MTLQKLRYESPVVEFLQFEDEDIIRTSGDPVASDGNTDTSAQDTGWGTWP